MRQTSVVVIGGGTGTYTVLSGLKQFSDQLDITAIVTMADSGGSTGRLRDEFGQLPVGDVRMALAALADEVGEGQGLLRQLFMHRFDRGDGLRGHNVGNLLLVALTDILGSEEAAIAAAGQVLRVSGAVLPVSTTATHLVATYADGGKVVGEHAIDEPEERRFADTVMHLSTSTAATINPAARRAILDADLIVLGPGDLFTSIIANCVIDGVAAALQASQAQLVYVGNLMTKRGQTTGMGMAAHVATLTTYTGRVPDVVLVHEGEIPEELLTAYAREHEFPVAADCDEALYRVVRSDMTAKETVVTQRGDVLRRSLVRHDPALLAEMLVELVRANSVVDSR